MKTLKNKDLYVYFGHSKQIYNSEEEKKQYKFLKSRFDRMIVPNINLPELGSVEKYLEIVKMCDLIIISEFQNFVGKGVFRECQTGIDNKIPIKVLRPYKNSFRLYPVKKIIEIDELSQDWIINFAKIIT